MRHKIYNVLKKIYAVMMCISFFAGFLPLIPFVIALLIGGQAGNAIYTFFFSTYFPYVIALGSLAIVVGLIAMYFEKVEDLSLKSMKKEK